MATAAAAGGGGGPWSSKAVGKKEGARRFLQLNLESAASNRSDGFYDLYFYLSYSFTQTSVF
jgi:hypothetical protein